jgi:vacuolar-type H+-ATPase subunit I/STV1
LNIEINNSVAENISLQQVNKSFPNIDSRKPGLHISPLLSGKKKSQPCTLQEIGNLNQRIDYYERRKAQLEGKINEQMVIKKKRESTKQNSLLYNLCSKQSHLVEKSENGSNKANRSFQKRENADTISLIEKLRKTSEMKNLSLLGELEPNVNKDSFADTSNLKCKGLGCWGCML